jgi:two-component system response regulator HydG
MAPASHILLVDDDDKLRKVLSEALCLEGHRVAEAAGLEQALELLKEHVFQLVVSDLRMPDAGEGLELLSHVQEYSPHTEVIIMTGFGTVDTAVEAMRAGAFDYHEKPLNLEHMLLTVDRALEKASLHHAYDYLRHEQPYIYRLESILAESDAMKQVLVQVARVSPTDVTVLLTGETGVGKSLIAGAIHANSPRHKGTLVTVNCAALTETLLESELFGHEKGAYTGAHKARAGRFQQAHGGTLFLDEVGDMSPAIQAKVLRAIEDKVIQRVGGSRSIQVDVRILAATNVDLEQAVRDGSFRRDLFYRLNVTPIFIPPLRERQADIIPLANKFLNIVCSESRQQPKPLTKAAQDKLIAHNWPGNIRELRNAVERATLFSGGAELTPADLGLTPTGQHEPEEQAAPPTLDLEDLERWAIRTALEKTDWVQSRAAELLGITPRALSYKLDKIDIDHPKLQARRRRKH